MKCPFCGHQDDRVLDTRVHRDGSLIRRRRECLNCKERFSTEETVMAVFPLVVKKDGRREPFAKDKILAGIQTACQKRPISLETLQQLVEHVCKRVVENFETEVSTKDIGELVMKEMFDLDDVAYVRFTSVYRQFTDIRQFMSELETTRLKDPPLSPISILSHEGPLQTEDGPGV